MLAMINLKEFKDQMLRYKYISKLQLSRIVTQGIQEAGSYDCYINTTDNQKPVTLCNKHS